MARIRRSESQKSRLTSLNAKHTREATHLGMQTDLWERSPMRIVFMGTPDFAVPALQAVAQAGQIVAVYTQPDRPVGRGLELRPSPVKRRALELGLEVRQPEKLTLPGEYEKLAELKPDLIIVVAYGQILRRNVLELPPLGCINIHSSLLPRWRGAAPIHQALLAGDTETGVTTMYMAEKLDAGDILLQEKTPIHETDTAGSLHDRLAEIGARLITQTITGLAQGSLQRRVQDENLVTYAGKLTKDMEWLDPNEPAEVAARKVRGLNPWPGTSIRLGTGERLRIREAKLRKGTSVTPGQLDERQGMLLLGTQGGSLELLKVQYDGKRETDAAAFLNGLKGRKQALPLAWTKG
jgi:methionyl-tRNA formyltransferase